MEKTDYLPGQFCWVDLQTSDVDGAKDFYSNLMGWDFREIPSERGPAYTLFLKNGLTTAGVGPQDPTLREARVPPVWSSYVCVHDVEATVARVAALEGNVVTPPRAVMEQGAVAFIEDPTGAHLGLWQPNSHKGASWVNDAGGYCWSELYTDDINKAEGFYEKLFDWKFQSSQSGGREYWIIKNAGTPNGGMMRIRPEWGEMPPNWSVYFTVESCGDALAHAESLGGTVYLAPMEAPGAGTFAGLQDPQGAHFLIIEMSNRS